MCVAGCGRLQDRAVQIRRSGGHALAPKREKYAETRGRGEGMAGGFSIGFTRDALSMAAINLESAAIVTILAAQCIVPSVT